jgi:hypothetical protein
MVLGLPILLVLGAAGAIVALVTVVLMVLGMGLKLLLPILFLAVPVVGVVLIARWLVRRRRGETPPTAPTPPTPPPPPAPAAPDASTIDPLET